MIIHVCVAAEGTPVTQERVHSFAEFNISLILQASDISTSMLTKDISSVVFRSL